MLDANPAIARGGLGEFWLGSCYTASQLIGIRRETGSDRDSIGMGRSLNSLASTPRMATRAWYEQRIRELEYKGSDFSELASMFDRFADPGAPFINSAQVRQDIVTLTAVTETVNAFTTKTLAHRDDRITARTPPPQPITWHELDDAIDTVGRIHKKYYSLRHPGESLGSLTPLKSLEWLRMFETAWMSPEFAVPDDLDNNPAP